MKIRCKLAVTTSDIREISVSVPYNYPCGDVQTVIINQIRASCSDFWEIISDEKNSFYNFSMVCLISQLEGSFNGTVKSMKMNIPMNNFDDSLQKATGKRLKDKYTLTIICQHMPSSYHVNMEYRKYLLREDSNEILDNIWKAPIDPNMYLNVSSIEQLLYASGLGDVNNVDLMEVCEKSFGELTEEEKNEDNCAICLDSFTTRANVILMLCCRKVIHTDCLRRWQEENNRCPLCRAGMVY